MCMYIWRGDYDEIILVGLMKQLYLYNKIQLDSNLKTSLNPNHIGLLTKALVNAKIIH